MSSSLAKRNPALQAKIEQMALPLTPLVRITTGEVCAAFPSTVLNFWLLTSDQLDDLAHFYHQRTPSKFTRYYPCPVEWGPNLTLEDKRRKIGRFIGLQGCETPVKIKSEHEIMEEARQARLEEEQELMRKARWY